MNGNYHRCGICKKDAKLFRPYGEFLRDHWIRCTNHIPKLEQDWYVPCIEDLDGSVWGYTSMPQSAIDRWNALPDVPPHAWSWALVLTIFLVIAT